MSALKWFDLDKPDPQWLTEFLHDPTGKWDEIAHFEEDNWTARKGKTLTRHWPADYLVTGKDHEHLPETEETEAFATVKAAKHDLRCDVSWWERHSRCELCGQAI